MQGTKNPVHCDSFKESSGARVEISLLSIGGEGQQDRPIQRRIDELPHGGSVGSIVSRLPFSSVDFFRKHTVRVVRLALILDGAMPDATRLRILHAGVCQRALLIQARGYLLTLIRHA